MSLKNFSLLKVLLKSRALLIGMSVLLMLLNGMGCRIQAGNPSTTKPKNPGNVTIALADAPVDDLASLFITVEAIAFAPSGTARCLSSPFLDCADKSVIHYDFTKELEVDLLTLSDGRTQVLPFAQELESGLYDGLRLFLSEGSRVRGILKNTGAEVEVEFPQGPFGRREFTLIQEFEVIQGSENEILVHVDVRRSLKKTPAGNYLLLPFVSVVPTRLAARLTGSVTAAEVTRICAYNVGGKRRPDVRPGYGHTPPPQMLTSEHQAHQPALPMRPQAQPPTPLSVMELDRSLGGRRPQASPVPLRQPGVPDSTSSCDNAEAVSDVKDAVYDLRYLPPVQYILRAFKSDGTYTDYSISVPLQPQETRVLNL